MGNWGGKGVFLRKGNGRNRAVWLLLLLLPFAAAAAAFCCCCCCFLLLLLLLQKREERERVCEEREGVWSNEVSLFTPPLFIASNFPQECAKCPLYNPSLYPTPCPMTSSMPPPLSMRYMYGERDGGKSNTCGVFFYIYIHGWIHTYVFILYTYTLNKHELNRVSSMHTISHYSLGYEYLRKRMLN